MISVYRDDEGAIHMVWTAFVWQERRGETEHVMIAAGEHRARAVEGRVGQSKQKKTKCVGVKFQITDGPHKGECIVWVGYSTPETRARAIDSLRACGVVGTGGDFLKLQGLSANEVILVVEHEVVPGPNGPKTFPRVQWVNRLEGAVDLSAWIEPCDKADSFVAWGRDNEPEVVARQLAAKRAASSSSAGSSMPDESRFE